jgi:hypothetical protein
MESIPLEVFCVSMVIMINVGFYIGILFDRFVLRGQGG